MHFIFKIYFKGLVQPKIKMMSLMTHPHVVPSIEPPFIFRTQFKIFENVRYRLLSSSRKEIKTSK